MTDYVCSKLIVCGGFWVLINTGRLVKFINKVNIQTNTITNIKVFNDCLNKNLVNNWAVKY